MIAVLRFPRGDSASTCRTPSETPIQNGAEQLSFGVPGTVSEDGVEVGTITVAAPTFTTHNTDEFGDAPKHGYFVLFTVTARALPGQTFSINPFDFYIRLADGTHVDGLSGSSYYGQNDLNATDLNSGEKVRGVVSFDAPRHGTLVYSHKRQGAW